MTDPVSTFGTHWGGISGNGRYIVFQSAAINLAASDQEMNTPFQSVGTPQTGNGDDDIFIHDVQTGATYLGAPDIRGDDPECDAGFGPSVRPSIDHSGRYVAFTSCGKDIIENDPGPGRYPWAWQVYMRDQGSGVGIGGFGDAPQSFPGEEVCIPELDVCVPPLGTVSASDSVGDLDKVVTDQGADLYGMSLAYRPQYGDVFAAIEAEYMPQVIPGVVSPIFYGLRFAVEDGNYEVRASSLWGGTFGLFDCTDACTQVAELRGGYGTTGERVVLSLPLEEIGLEEGGRLSDVEAFSGMGAFHTGAAKILDRVMLRK